MSLEYDVYVRRRIMNITSEELPRLLAYPSRDVVITTQRHWEAMASIPAPGWHVIARRTVGHKEMVVVGNSSQSSR